MFVYPRCCRCILRETCEVGVIFPVGRGMQYIHRDCPRAFPTFKILHYSTKPILDQMRKSKNAFPESGPYRQDFTAGDRRAVVESLLGREDIVGHLFDMIFPMPMTSSSKRIRPLESNAGL